MDHVNPDKTEEMGLRLILDACQKITDHVIRDAWRKGMNHVNPATTGEMGLQLIRDA